MFWDTLLEILVRKVREGVEVRFMYDDMGCISTLTGRYDEIILKVTAQKRFPYEIRKPFLILNADSRTEKRFSVCPVRFIN